MDIPEQSSRQLQEKAKDLFFVALAYLIVGGLLGYILYGVHEVAL